MCLFQYPEYGKYRVRPRGCSLTHSARTPPAVHPGMTIGGGGEMGPHHLFFGAKSYFYKGMQKFKIISKPLLREKYVEGKTEKRRKKKKKEERIMPSLVTTMSALARTTCSARTPTAKDRHNFEGRVIF